MLQVSAAACLLAPLTISQHSASEGKGLLTWHGPLSFADELCSVEADVEADEQEQELASAKWSSTGSTRVLVGEDRDELRTTLADIKKLVLPDWVSTLRVRQYGPWCLTGEWPEPEPVS